MEILLRLTVVDRYVTPFSRTYVVGSRAYDAVVRPLLKNMGAPTRHASYGE
jgi:hypothetical protein